MLKIGLSVTDPMIDAGILETMQKIGYNAVDYGVLGDYAVPNPIFSEDREVWTAYYAERKRLFASYGLFVSQTHATYNTDYDVAGEVTDKIIAQFEKENLVEKISVNNHFYRAPIRLTMEGRSIAEDIITKATTAVELGGKGLTDVDRNTFYEALELISANLRVLAEEGLKK